MNIIYYQLQNPIMFKENRFNFNEGNSVKHISPEKKFTLKGKNLLPSGVTVL